MSRIRSIHPGLWTDENFVELSPDARLFLIGIWGEADDYGVFEWKPRRLKMRLAPVDNIDAEDLLDQLQRFKQVVRLERNGRMFGIVRNFRLFQRPKNPSAPLIPLDREITDIIGLTKADSPTPVLPQHEPLPTEITPQMEDGIGGDKGGGVDVRTPLQIVGERVVRIMRCDTNPNWTGNFGLAEVWLKRGFDPEMDIYPTVERLVAQSQGPPITSLKYFDRAIAQAYADRNRSIPEPSHVNGTRSRPAKPGIDDRYAEIDRLSGDGTVPLESFADAAGGIVIDNPAQRH